MSSIKKAVLTLIGSALIVALIAGGVALVSTSLASAQSDVPDTGTQTQDGARPFFKGGDMFGGRGGPERFGDKPGGEKDTYLADALGISVEELQAAIQTANEAAIDQMLEEGLITEEQAEAMKARGGFFGKGAKGGRHGGPAGEGAVDYDAMLADALDISVEELQAAREAAFEAAIAAAVESGDLTQEQADLKAAYMALKEYMHPEVWTAEALGLSADELQAAKKDGKRIPELLEEQGISQEDFRAAMQAAHEEAIQQAVEDGVLTQDQADQILSNEGGFGHGFDRGGFPGFGGPGKGGRGGRGGPCVPGGETTPENTSDA